MNISEQIDRWFTLNGENANDETCELLNNAQGEIIRLGVRLNKACSLLDKAVHAWESSEKIQPGTGFCSFHAAWLTKDWYDSAVAIAKESSQTGKDNVPVLP